MTLAICYLVQIISARVKRIPVICGNINPMRSKAQVAPRNQTVEVTAAHCQHEIFNNY